MSAGLNLDLTYNTDFAQVEVDEQQINLTRFNLLFPEKRPFFLENRGMFASGKSGKIDLFFSRRIGITGDGTPVPIRAGARMSGRARGVNIGLLDMQTRGVTGVAAENFAVARVRDAITRTLNVGGIFINRSTTDGPQLDNQSFGIDADFNVICPEQQHDGGWIQIKHVLLKTKEHAAGGVAADTAIG